MTDVTNDFGHCVVFDIMPTAAGEEQIKAKDNTHQRFFIEYIELCCGSGAGARLFDGSAGNAITPKIACASNTTLNYRLDCFRDPIVCEGTTSLCISYSEADQPIAGVVKYFKG